MIKTYFFLGLIILATFTGCKKKDSQPFLSISPTATEIEIISGQVFTIDITGKSQSKDPLIKMLIETISPAGQKSTTYDTTFSSDNLNMSYDYKAPTVISTESYTIKFTLTDGNGLATVGALRLKVNPAQTAVKEYTGLEMYSGFSTKKDGYSISTVQGLYQDSQLSICEIYDFEEFDSLHPYLLGRLWKTKTGLQFVKFNQFDYANATPTTIKSSYDGGVKSSFVDNIVPGDIVLSRLSHANPDSGYFAIKLIYVIDNADTTNADNDKYIFNIKK